MRILLTGATGFLGIAVARVLAERGHRLRIVHRSSSNTTQVAHFSGDLHRGEITDPVVMNLVADGMDAIVHMAADLSHWARYRDRITRTNVLGTRIVAEAAKTVGVPVLLHTSSIAAVGYSPAADGTPIAEDAPNNFVPMRLLYHESKRMAEEEASDARRYGVKVVIVNPGVLYGPRSLHHTFGHTMLELAHGKISGHPTGGLSIADVDDVADGMANALDRGVDGQRYILGGHNLTYRESFQRQAAAAGAPYRGRALPAAVLTAAAAAFELQSRFTHREPRLTFDNAAIAPLTMWYSSGKAAAHLDYRIRPFEATLERMARAYRDAGLLNGRAS